MISHQKLNVQGTSRSENQLSNPENLQDEEPSQYQEAARGGAQRKNLNFWILMVQCLVVSTGCLANSYIPPILSSYGYSTLTIGRTASIYAVALVLTKPLWGIVNDKFSCPRQAVLTGIGCSALGYALLTNLKGNWISLGMAVFIQVFYGSMSNTVDSWVIKLRREGYDINYGATRGGASIAFAFLAIGFGAVAARYGYKPGNYVLITFFLLLIICSLQIPNPQAVSTKESDDVNLINGLKHLISNKYYVLALTAFFTCTLGTACIDSFYSILIMEKGGTDQTVGAALCVQAISEVPAMLGYAAIKKKTGAKPLTFLAFGLTCYCIRALNGGFDENPYALVAASAGQMLSYGIFLPACMDFLDDILGKEYLATGTLVFFAVGTNVATAVANNIWGSISYIFDLSTAFKLASCLIIISGIYCFIISRLYIRDKN